MFRFPFIKYDKQVNLEIAPISKIDAEKVVNTDHEKFFLGRKKNSDDRWYIVGERKNKRNIIKRLLKKEVGKVVGYS